jgi:agmatinase
MNHTHLFPFNLTKIEDCLDELSGVPIYVSIDVDVVDPSAAPGTGTPEPGGVTLGELLRALETMKDLDVVGIDIVEVSPPQDINGITAALAAKVIREALILWG